MPVLRGEAFVSHSNRTLAGRAGQSHSATAVHAVRLCVSGCEFCNAINRRSVVSSKTRTPVRHYLLQEEISTSFICCRIVLSVTEHGSVTSQLFKICKNWRGGGPDRKRLLARHWRRGMILKWTLKKLDGEAWTVLLWFRIGTAGSRLLMR